MRVLQSWKLVKDIYKVGNEGEILEGYRSLFMGASVVILNTKHGTIGIGVQSVELVGDVSSSTSASIPCS